MPDGHGDDTALDHALDELYGVDPAEFVARRKQLVADLRASGSKDQARDLAKARRPSNAAWALNAIARANPDLITAAIEAGTVLARQVRAGDAAQVRNATRDRRRALDAATDAAIAAVSRLTPNAEALRGAVAASLEAASIDDDLAAELIAGRLAHEPEATIGFPEVPGLKLVPRPVDTPTAGPAPSTVKPPNTRSAERASEARAARQAAAKAELDALRSAADVAENLAEVAASDADGARARQDEARSLATEARRALAAAERDLRAAVAIHDQRAAAARRAAAALARRERRGGSAGST